MHDFLLILCTVTCTMVSSGLHLRRTVPGLRCSFGDAGGLLAESSSEVGQHTPAVAPGSRCEGLLGACAVAFASPGTEGCDRGCLAEGNELLRSASGRSLLQSGIFRLRAPCTPLETVLSLCHATHVMPAEVSLSQSDSRL